MEPEQLMNDRKIASHEDLEEGSKVLLDFYKLDSVVQSGSQDLIPVVVQNTSTGEVLILAYANAEALRLSLERRIAVLYSTSRRQLWIKGETSGDYLDLIDVRVNCEQNSLLYLVKPRKGGVCHTRDASGHTRPSCYYRRIADDGSTLEASRTLPWHDNSK